MQTYALSDVRNRHGEVFGRAFVEPVLVTNHRRRSHVIMEAGYYEALVARLTELEDQVRACEQAGASPSRGGTPSAVAEEDHFARQMALAEEVISRYRNTLRELAK